ncbi:MAG: AMP-binding protein, partial [Chloroflexi bacterium]|nr:AMP-binding protein [Chloroflexota bacterium]
MVTEETLPKLLLRNYEMWGDGKIAMRRKDFGIWEVFTWKDVYEKVKYFALAMISNGFEPGDKVATLGDNDPELFWAELAAQAAGGAMTGIFSDCLPEEVRYQAWHSDSKFIVARDQEQVDKVIKIKDELPLLQKVIYWDPKGMANYNEPYLSSFNAFLEQGMEYEKDHAGLFEERVANTKPEDIAVILYTSGTTGLPKGTIASHRSLLRWSGEMLAADPLVTGDNTVSFTLPGWIVEQLFVYCNMMMVGTTMNFPETLETVQTDLREIAPNILLYASRLWERLNSDMQVRINDSSWIKKLTYNLFAPVGYRMADLHMQKKKPDLLWRSLYAIAYLMLFRPLLDKHGLTNVKFAYTAGAILGPDIFRFFRAMGINIKQIYGITEIGIGTLHRDDDIAFESVGRPVGAGKNIRISNDGEILVDAAHCFDGYYKDEEAYENAT